MRKISIVTIAMLTVMSMLFTTSCDSPMFANIDNLQPTLTNDPTAAANLLAAAANDPKAAANLLAAAANDPQAAANLLTAAANDPKAAANLQTAAANDPQAAANLLQAGTNLAIRTVQALNAIRTKIGDIETFAIERLAYKATFTVTSNYVPPQTQPADPVLLTDPDKAVAAIHKRVDGLEDLVATAITAAKAVTTAKKLAASQPYDPTASSPLNNAVQEVQNLVTETAPGADNGIEALTSRAADAVNSSDQTLRADAVGLVHLKLTGKPLPPHYAHAGAAASSSYRLANNHWDKEHDVRDREIRNNDPGALSQAKYAEKYIVINGISTKLAKAIALATALIL